MAISANMTDAPMVNTMRRYIRTKAPPPFIPVTYGNLQMLPRPTAEPAAAMMKPKRLPHCSRSLVDNQITPLLHMKTTKLAKKEILIANKTYVINEDSPITAPFP
jgi:hypothetical protein